MFESAKQLQARKR